MAYTNSPLVAYTKLSPNHSGQRTEGISRISPHCVVGNISAESLGEWFAKPSTQASSNYGIDKDGRVGMYVEEKNRSWCTSSNANDQRAVTIECASDTKEPYTMNAAVYSTLIKLCTDICKRNGKKKLLWLADKEKTLAYTPAADEMVITVHRWFANKSCPGEWLYSRLGDLAARVTEALGSVSSKADTSSDTDNEKAIWDYLYGKIGNAYGTAGLLGNLFSESGLDPCNLQNSYNRKLNITDEEYTQLVDGGNYPDFVTDKAGYGLAQWTYCTRKQALLDFAKSRGKSIGDLGMQLDFLWKELSGSYGGLLDTLKNAASVKEASDAVLTVYERPADQSDAVKAKRASYGEEYFRKYAAENIQLYRVRKAWKDASSQAGAFRNLQNAKDCADRHPGYSVFDENGDAIYAAVYPASGWGDPPFLVRVTIKHLNIRTDAGTDKAKTGRVTGAGVFTIVEVKSGKGATNGWGRLKSGGWISLDYCTAV